MLTEKEQAKYAIVAIDYFTKWVKAELLASIMERKTIDFIWRNLIYRYDIPNAIVSDNEKQLTKNFRVFAQRLG